MKKCPFCAEEIREDAIKCRFCGTMLSGEPRTAAAGPTCSYCHASVASGARRCANCGGALRKGHALGNVARFVLAFCVSAGVVIGTLALVGRALPPSGEAAAAQGADGGTEPDGGARRTPATAPPPPAEEPGRSLPGREPPGFGPPRREPGKSAG